MILLSNFITSEWVLGIAVCIIGGLMSILISVAIKTLKDQIKATKSLTDTTYQLAIRLEVEKKDHTDFKDACVVKHLAIKETIDDHEDRIRTVERDNVAIKHKIQLQ